MRKLTVAALTVALVTAPAWAHGPNAPKPPHNFYVPNIAVGEPYGHNPHHGHGHNHGGYPRPHHHGKGCHYVQGYYDTVYQQVWVPGQYRQDYVPPVYKQKRVNGVVFTVMVKQGYHTRVWVPGHYTTKTCKVWREGYWSCSRW